VSEPTIQPCRGCPWFAENHGKPHPDGWYTKRNLAGLWKGLRRGESMSCHPTDPTNPVSDKAQAKGYRPAPDGAKVRRCAGAEILQQRELQIVNDLARTEAKALQAYRRLRPGGLTADGIARLIERAVFGAMSGDELLTVNLNAPVDNGTDRLPWTSRKRSDD
jgi:hypothetical protein